MQTRQRTITRLCVRRVTHGLPIGEYRRAIVAAYRYQQLKRMPRARDDPETSVARRIYLEFYSPGKEGGWSHGKE